MDRSRLRIDGAGCRWAEEAIDRWREAADEQSRLRTSRRVGFLVSACS